MKLKVIPIGILFALLGSWLSAQEATILRLVGASSVEVILPDSDDPAMMAQGQVIPEGSLVTVPDGGKLFLRTFAGTITTVEGGSTIFVEQVEQVGSKEVTRIELKSGDLVAVLDPAKRDVNDYGVRTPKGVAAARGTNYGVSVAGQELTMSVNGGNVELQLTGGGSIDFSAGTVLLPGATQPVPLAQAISNPAVRQAVQATSNALAQIAADPAGSGMSTEAATAALANVVTTVAQTGDTAATAEVAASAAIGNPSLAASVVQTATAANPQAAAQVVATTQSALEQQGQTVDSQNLIDAANTGVNEANDANEGSAGDIGEIDAGDVEAADPEDVPEIEVPNDNVVVSPSS